MSTDVETPRPAVMKRPVVKGGLVLVGIVVVIGSLIFASRGLTSPQQAAADARPPEPSRVTSKIERRVLQEPVIIRATVEAGVGTPLLPPTSLIGPDAVVTDVFAAAGVELKDGVAIVEVAGRPLWSFNFAFPLYRDIRGGDTGPDIVEIQRALTRLDYGLQITGVLDLQTQNTLAMFYTQAGYVVPTDGGEENQDVVAKTQAINTALAAKTDTSNLRTELSHARLQAGPVVRRADFVRLDAMTRTVSTSALSVGQVLSDAAVPLAVLDAKPSAAIATVKESIRASLKVGQAAMLYDDLAGTSAKAVVSSLAEKLSTDSSGVSGFKVSFSSETVGSAGRSVRVVIVSDQSSTEVLAVPVASLFSSPDGHTFVSVKTDNGFVDTEVSVGAIAGGFVEIHEPARAGLNAGMRVLVGEN